MSNGGTLGSDGDGVCAERTRNPGVALANPFELSWADPSFPESIFPFDGMGVPFVVLELDESFKESWDPRLGLRPEVLESLPVFEINP